MCCTPLKSDIRCVHQLEITEDLEMKDFMQITIQDGKIIKSNFKAWLSLDDVLLDNPRSRLSFSQSEFASSNSRYDKKYLFGDIRFNVLGENSVFGIGRSNKMFLYCFTEDEDSAAKHLVTQYKILMERARDYYQNELNKINMTIDLVDKI